MPAALLLAWPIKSIRFAISRSGHSAWTSAYQNHVSIALGSQGELETEIEIALRNVFMARETCERLMALNDRVGAMLYRLHESLN